MERKLLVLCVDRDDDLGRKLGIEGPLLGVEENLEAAKRFALEDPEDTDVNTMFAALKLARELGCGIATLTGTKELDPTSDLKLVEQLEKVLAETGAEEVILVTDGMDDEQVLPIVQSRVKISGLRRVTVRQSMELEKAYFKTVEFLKEIQRDQRVARLVFGVPGLILVFIALGGIFQRIWEAMSVVLLLVGSYFVIRGFGLEERVFTQFSRLVSSFSVEKVSTLTYLVAGILLLLGVVRAIENYSKSAELGFAKALFFSALASADILLLGFGIALGGRMLDAWIYKRYKALRRDLLILAFLIMLRLLAGAGVSFYLYPQTFGLVDLTLNLVLGVMIFVVVLKLTAHLAEQKKHALTKVI